MNQNLGFKPEKTGRLSQENSKKYFSRIGLACFILGMVSLLIPIASRLLIRDMLPWVLNDKIISTLISYGITLVALYVIAFPLASLATAPLPRVSPMKEKMKLSHVIAAICISFMLTFVGSYISDLILMLIPSQGESLEVAIPELSNIELIIHAVFLSLVFPILEELLFRKFLCSRLLPLGEGYAVFFSAIIFSLVSGELYQIPYSFLIGIFFGFIYVKTGKIIYPIILNCAVNLYTNVIGLFLMAKLPIEEILESLENNVSAEETAKIFNEHIGTLQIYAIMSIALFGLIIAGFIICYKAIKREKFSLETGIIPPEKEHRVSNILLSSGVAAAVFFVAAKIILPMFIDKYL